MMASSVENPASSDDGLGAQLDDLESALAAAKAASSEPRTVEAMERLMDAKIALLEARLAKAAPFEGAINAVVARWTEAPTNWHQSTAYFAVLPREDEDAGRRWNAMLGGVLMVIAQCMAVVGLFVGTFIPSCMSNDQCEQKGTFCWLGRTDRCDKCGSATPLVVETGVNDPDAADFVGFNTTAVAEICRNPVDVVQINNGGFEDIYPRAAVASWCAACVHPLDMSVDPVTEQSVARAEFDAMATFDWIALLFAAFMVALAVIGELKDIELVDLAVRRAEDKLEQRWVLALRLLGGVRRWLFLPTLVMAVPFIVLMKGGDALSVCFNTVALLFLCDIDNLTYRILLNERLRTRVEERGRVALADAEVAALANSKAVHVSLVVLVIPLGMWAGKDNLAGVMLLPRVAFWLGGVAEVGHAGGTAAEIAKGVAEVTGAFVIGFGAFGGLFGSAFVI